MPSFLFVCFSGVSLIFLSIQKAVISPLEEAGQNPARRLAPVGFLLSEGQVLSGRHDTGSTVPDVSVGTSGLPLGIQCLQRRFASPSNYLT